MYRAVAATPHAGARFETGRELAERQGYPAERLDGIPSRAVESFAGGHFWELAELSESDAVLHMGSGSGMDAFFTALAVGVDMTDEQLAKADRLQREHGFDNVSIEHGRIEDLRFEDGSFDV